MSSIKRWIITGVSFGAGLAITLVLIWYENRPKPPEPWNTKAITATYDYIDTEGEDNSIVFYYTLQNNTDLDYRISSESTVSLMAKLKEQKSLERTISDQFLKFDFPIFIPSKQRLRCAIHLNYSYNKKIKDKPTKDEREKYRKELSNFLKEELTSNLNGFALFDEFNRYQIDFSKGW